MAKVSKMIADAVNNTGVKCPFTESFDPSSVEIAGIVPEGARGLLALAHEQRNRITVLVQQIKTAEQVMQSAQRLGAAIIRDENPKMSDRTGMVFGADWSYFARGPSDKRKTETAEKHLFGNSLEAEMQRAVDKNDDVDGSYAGLRDNLFDLMHEAGMHHRSAAERV
jgi:hypothetical protein